MDSNNSKDDPGWARLDELGPSAGREQWAAVLAGAIGKAWAPWLMSAEGACEMDGAPRADRLAKERSAISMALDGFGRVARAGHWSAAVKALGMVSEKRWALGRANVGRVAMSMAALSGAEHAAGRYEELAQCCFFDKDCGWAQAERNLKADYWPTTSGRDEEPGDEMGYLLLAKARRPKELSARSMSILAQSRVESASMFPDEFDWIDAGARMAIAAKRRFMSASQLDADVFDAFPAQAWLGVRASSTKASKLGAWAWPHLLGKAKGDAHLRAMWGAVELMRFDLEDLERFEAEFPGSLSSEAKRGSSLGFPHEIAKMRQLQLASSALGRSTGKWARPAFGDSKQDQEWQELIAGLPGVCALFEASLLKKIAQRAEKAKPKKSPRL